MSDHNIFREYDIRGIYPEQINADLYEKIGYVLGKNFSSKKVCVCMDGRNSSDILKNALIKGLVCSSIEVIDIGQLPTPLLNYSLHRLGVDNGLMITASHNPKSYNGLKMVIENTTLYGEAIQNIYKKVNEIENIEFKKEGTITLEKNILSYYIAELEKKFVLKKDLKVCIDCSNGVTGHVSRKLFRKLGINFKIINEEVNGDFPNHSPDPTKEDNLSQLKNTMKESKSEIGIAFDGDGDRLIVVDNNLRVIWPDELMMIYAKDVLTKKDGNIVFDVKCSENLEKIINNMGGTPLRSRTGHSYIKKSLKENNALLAGEMSGHIFGDDWYGFDDGMFAAVKLLEIITKNKDAQDVFNWLPISCSTPEINIEFQENEHFDFLIYLLN